MILIEDLRRWWHRFWFAPATGHPESAFRIAYASVVLIDLLGYLGEVNFWFANTGVHPRTHWDWLFFPAVVPWMYILWLLTLLFLLFGRMIPLTTAANFLFLLYFYGLRGYAAPFEVEWVYQAMGFYLIWMPCDRHFTLSRPPSPQRPFSPIWPLRLAQLHLAAIYFTAGISKSFDPGWASGIALQEILRNPVVSFHAIPAGPALIICNYLVMVFQLSFPFLLFFRSTRKCAAGGMLLFHTAIALTLRVDWFSGIMMACLFLFFDDFLPTAAAAAPRSPSGARLASTFLVFHMAAFLWVHAIYLALETAPSHRWRSLLYETPLLSPYALFIARMLYFDLVPSAMFTEPGRFLRTEVIQTSGATVVLPLFRGSREGLLVAEAAQHGFTREQWDAYFSHLLMRYRSIYPTDPPRIFRVFLLEGPLEAFRHDSTRRPESWLIVEAQAELSAGWAVGEARFTHKGKAFLKPDRTYRLDELLDSESEL